MYLGFEAPYKRPRGPTTPCPRKTLMSDPMLREKKFLKSVLSILEERSHDRNSIVCQMAVRGLGNLVYGAPEKVKKYKKFLLDILIGALHDIFSSEVIGESMKALAKVLKELKEKDIGSSFKDLTQQIRTYFDDEDDALRSMAFVLFGILARLTKRKWKTYFADQVKQNPNPEISMLCLVQQLSSVYLFPKDIDAISRLQLKPSRLLVIPACFLPITSR
uniref:Maestro/Maestro-like HEAT-repeats domain-containing protein n=1 Tax=Terrapene triunguis TaxID=2587831 RepID=A0A674JGN4_9SAUR